MNTKNNYGSRIREKGHELVVDLGDLRKILVEAVESKYESMKHSAGSTLSSVKDSAVSAARQTGERATAMVRKSPWKSMAGAAAVGMLAAWILRRK